MFNLILAEIHFPEGSGISQLVYWLLGWITDWGWVGYGVAIVIFTVFIKLMLLPLDFCNRYLSKKNQLNAKALAPEEAALKEQYASDPMAYYRARQALHRKHGVGGGGAGLLTFGYMILTMIIFVNVFGALGAVSNHNINLQVEGLHETYINYADKEDTAGLSAALNATYDESNESFLWVKNIWRPDTFWSSSTMSWGEYSAIKSSSVEITQEEYEEIFAMVNEKHGGVNGWFLLVILACAASYGSTALSTYMMAKGAPKKAVGTKAEPIISYSLRDARQNQGGADTPTVDPAQVSKIMQFVMPIIMFFFVFQSTAAMAVYIIASSVIGTALTLGLGALIDLIIKHQKPKETSADKFDPTVINPHAKYFKGKH